MLGLALCHGLYRQQPTLYNSDILIAVSLRGKNILEQLSRTRVFMGFKSPALFFPDT